jgi:hypothetical protein
MYVCTDLLFPKVFCEKGRREEAKLGRLSKRGNIRAGAAGEETRDSSLLQRQ